MIGSNYPIQFIRLRENRFASIPGDPKMKLILLALAMAALSNIGSAADMPKFSGEWKMNPAKSNYAGFPAPASMVRKIALTEPSLVIVEEQTGGASDGTTTRKYTTDGKASAFEINGTAIVGSAAWDGAAIIVNTIVESVGLSFKDRMSLSADGKELTSVVQIASQQGPAELTIVFDRQ
jgi:hypothetical protein